LPPDATRGAAVYDRVCAACHQADGLGKRWGAPADARGYQFPPVWGPDSFSDGAGMDHFQRASASSSTTCARHRSRPSQLTLQEAWDAAALLQSKPAHYEPAR